MTEHLTRERHLRLALAALAELAERDSSIIGATLMLPDGEVIYLPAETVRRPATVKAPQ